MRVRKPFREHKSWGCVKPHIASSVYVGLYRGGGVVCCGSTDAGMGVGLCKFSLVLGEWPRARHGGT